MKEKDGIYDRLDEENARRRHLSQSDNPPQKQTDEDEAHPDMTGMQYGCSLAYNARELEDPEFEEKQEKRLWLRVEIHKAAASSTESRFLFNAIFDWIYDSPMREWEAKLYCLRYSNEHGSGKSAFDEAKELFDRLM